MLPSTLFPSYFPFVYVSTLIEKINIIKIYENVLTSMYVQDII